MSTSSKIALKILMGDKAKYIGLIFGVTFATLLMAQQISIFISVMGRSANAIYAVPEADIWVMDTRVRYIEEVEPMRDIELYNVRSVKGVEWAVPFYKGLSTIRMPDGLTQQVQLIGVDDISMVGTCPQMVMGDNLAIQKPQNAMMDRNGYFFTWPNSKLELGRRIELNDNRLIINAICKVNPTFYSFPIMYVSYQTAMQVTPQMRNKLPFVLVKAKPDQDLQELKHNIEKQTGLQALTRSEFAWRSINYILERTGIPINFSITIILGVIIGAAITAQTFYIFVIENLKQFGAMKAIGFTNSQLLRMVMLQAMVVGLIGYCIGIGLTALFFEVTRDIPALQGFMLRWQVMIGVFVVIFTVIVFSVGFSLNKVFKLDPAIVFKT